MEFNSGIKGLMILNNQLRLKSVPLKSAVEHCVEQAGQFFRDF